MEIKSMNIDHLGIISAMCDEIGLVEVINEFVPPDKSMKLSIGSRIKAILINCLGFTGRPFYLSSQFFAKRPVKLLVDENATPELLNDDALGRALDALYENNAELIFTVIAARAIKKYKVNTKKLHLDSTSVSVEGEYLSDPNIGLMQFGHSKDLRPDLKQMMASALVTSDGGVPLIAKMLPGNTSDATHFREALRELQKNALESDNDFVVVFDAAGYNKKMLCEITSIKWVSRVPCTISEVKKIKNEIEENRFVEIENGYSICEIYSKYGGVEQRWFVVRSKEAYESKNKTLGRAIKHETDDLESRAKHIHSKKFCCKEDALKYFNDLSLPKYHKIELVKIHEQKHYLKKGKPKIDDPFEINYMLETKIVENSNKIEQLKDEAGKFIIATNELDQEKMSAANALKTYKDQSCVERGFRFLKNPICMTSSVNLKKQSRIIAFGVIMFLSLLVYSLAERELRRALEQNNETIPSQVNKPTKTPTMRWVFQMMEGVIINEYVENNKLVIQFTNLDNVLRKILTLLGSAYMKIYNISSDA